jgi:hypothetical protein
MKYVVISTLIGMSVAATGAVSASADTFAVHGYQGTVYGDR